MKKLKKAIRKTITTDYTSYFNYGVNRSFLSSSLHSFSIVTACYNSESYLNSYFKSIFESSYPLSLIELILVDDGSVDNTKSIISFWMSKYPDNIKYIYQANSGQALARNNGLEYVTRSWVTFIDSDDFISPNYFSEVNFAINLSRSNYLISTKWINYYEDVDEYRDVHPLTYRFRGRLRVLMRDMRSNQNSFQLAMNSVFFKTSVIQKYQLRLKDIKPQFEDAVFVFEYMKCIDNFKIAFVKNAHYYYRKRSDNSSTLNLAHFDSTRYVELLRNAYLYILKVYFDKYGVIYDFVQNAVIYDLSWNIKELESNKVVLSLEDKLLRKKYLREIFAYINFENIQRKWKYLWRMYQIGINNKYYQNKFDVVSGAYYFYETNEYFKIQLISTKDCWSFSFAGKTYKLEDFDYRVYEEKLNGEFFVNKYYVKIPKVYLRRDLNTFSAGKYISRFKNFKIQTNINASKYLFKNINLSFNDVPVRIANYKNTFDSKNFSSASNILFYDRVNKADDNAEVFYDYILENHPEYQNIFFAIFFDSPDYSRLQSKGYKLIDYGSEEFVKAYQTFDYIISSGFDRRIENYQNMRYNSYKSRAKFIFLQHGIITDDLSEWFSSKRVDKVVTSASFEYNNLINKYTIFDDEVVLSGLPRYDKLYNAEENFILLQLTWRMQYQNYSSEKFAETEYFKNIIKIFKDVNFLNLLKVHNLILKFIPHPEVNKHIHLFEVYQSEFLQICNIENISFRDEFARARLMITDYSSVYTDFSYLKKPIIYYQYDIENFYQGHLYTPELNYETDGLGPVAKEHASLINMIKTSVESGFKIEDVYLKRINAFFKYNDTSNCKRLFMELNDDKKYYFKKDNYIHVTVLNLNSEKGESKNILYGKVLIKVNNKILFTINTNTTKKKVDYFNIVIPHKFILNDTYQLEVVNLTNGEVKYDTKSGMCESDDQINYNLKYDILEHKISVLDIDKSIALENEFVSLYFSERKTGNSVKKILVTFGGYNHFDAKIRYPISYLRSLNDVEDLLIVSFQDKYFVDGTYYMVDNNGIDLMKYIKLLLKAKLKEHSLKNDDLIFFGSSKGGTTALTLSSEFEKSNVIVNAPQINIKEFIKHKIHHLGLNFKYLEHNNKHNFSIQDDVVKLLETNKIFYAYSPLDRISNCNLIENLEHENLVKKKYDCGHRHVAENAWNEEKELIKKLLLCES